MISGLLYVNNFPILQDMMNLRIMENNNERHGLIVIGAV
jgi:hypothetical protein